MTYRETAVAVLMVSGSVLMLLAAIGILRFPDLFLRMSSATKAVTVGAGSTLLAVAIYFNDLGTTTRALATVIFLVLTVPVGAHMISRAAYFVGVPLWEGTAINRLLGHYDLRTHVLSSETADQTPEECADPECLGPGPLTQ